MEEKNYMKIKNLTERYKVEKLFLNEHLRWKTFTYWLHFGEEQCMLKPLRCNPYTNH